jgi:hypothetical protein
MKNHKGQVSLDKKAKTKKDYMKNNKKITEFFSNYINGINTNNTDEDLSPYGKKENDINVKGEEELVQEEKFIELIDDDDSSLNSNNANRIYNNSNKKKLKKKMEEKKNNDITHFERNPKRKDIFSPSFFINLNTHSVSDEKRNLILMDFEEDNKINLRKLNINSNCFENKKDYHKSFPFQNCRIININNSSYIIGGKINDDFSKMNYNNQIGVKDAYKLVCENSKKIKIIRIPSTLFEHQSHSLLYLEKYNSIAVCSGYQQKNCEYFNLKDNKWEMLYPLRKPRENAISLLFNEKYIFLIGGNDSNGKINEDYDVLNYDVCINGKYQCYWNTYSFKDKDKNLLIQKGSGIIYNNDNIFIFGGFNSQNKFLSWKINFDEDKEGKRAIFFMGNQDKIYKISSVELCDNINNYILGKNNYNNYSFCGEQVFMNYKNFFVNISFGGQLSIIPNFLLN